MEERDTFIQYYSDNIYQELIKILCFVSVQIQYLPSCLLTLVEEGKFNSKAFRKTVTYGINPEPLSCTKKLLTSTSITLDCKTPVSINSEPLVSSANITIVITLY